MARPLVAWQESEAALRYVLERIDDFIQRLARRQGYLERQVSSFAEELEERVRRCQRRIQALREQRARLDDELSEAQALLLDYEAVLAGETILSHAAASVDRPLVYR